MKANAIKEKSVAELKEMLIGLREDQFKTRMQMASGEVKTNHQVKQIRRDIARVKTFLNEKAGLENG